MSKISLLKPEIVQVISYYPPHLGGMENCAAQIAEGFVDKGYPVSVYTSDIGYSRSTVPDSKARVHYLKSLEFAHTPIIFTLFFRLLALPRHSLMHIHVSQAYSPEIVYMISKLRRIPYIAHIHLDVDPSGPFGFLLGTYKKFFLKRVLQAAAKIICLSEQQKKLIAAKYTLPAESIVVIPNGVAEKYFIGQKKSENTVPHLLFVGRLAPQKNLSLLIGTVAQMQTDVFLDIVGEGEERENIEALIQQHKLQNIKLCGKKTGQELIELYKSADIFVLPSLKEGISLSMLEALAAGLPVVASDSPEIRPILGECGVLIQDPTTVSYARALDELAANKDKLHHLSDLSVKKARSYSWENVLASIEEVYREVTSLDTPPEGGEARSKAHFLGKCLFLVVFVVLAIYGIFYTWSSSIATGKAQSETFTELYFEDNLHLPSEVIPKRSYFFQFTLHNLEGKDMEYPYEVYIEVGQEKLLFDKGTIFVKENDYRTIQERFATADVLPKSEIVVDLVNKNQQIDFWIEGSV